LPQDFLEILPVQGVAGIQFAGQLQFYFGQLGPGPGFFMPALAPVQALLVGEQAGQVEVGTGVPGIQLIGGLKGP